MYQKQMRLPGLLLLLISIISACSQPQPHKSGNSQDVTVPKAAAQQVPDSLLIIPGKRIGKISLGESANSVTRLLGRPDTGDAAMGSSLMAWYAGHDTTGYKTSIFSQHNYGAADEATAFIKRIRVTSPAFKTAAGLGAGLNFGRYAAYFKLTKQRTYTKRNKTIQVFNDAGQGIAFEIDSTTHNGVAIIIFKPGTTSTSYISME